MTLEEALQEMVTALSTLTAEIPELQIYPYVNTAPTPPSIDIYPGEPFQEGAGFGVGEKKVRWTVRARVSYGDQEAATRLLLRMMDATDAASVEAALARDNVAAIGNDGGISGYGVYADEATGGSLLGSLWNVEMFI